MPNLHGPHIPFKQPGEQLDDAKIKNNWLEIERWSARLQEQIGGLAFTWSVNLSGPQSWQTGDPPLLSGASSFEPYINRINFAAAAEDVDGSDPNILRPVIQRDGIYIVSTTVWFAAPAATVPDTIMGVYIGVSTDTVDDWFIEAPGSLHRISGSGTGLEGAISATNAAIPMRKGEKVRLHAQNDTGADLDWWVQHLAVTYTSEYKPASGGGGGGPTV